MEKAIYLAGVPVWDQDRGMFQLQLIHNTSERRPYLTHNDKGLALTRHHANLYVLSQDYSKVRCVIQSYMEGMSKCPREYTLSDEDRTLIQEAIDTNYFFA